MSVQPLRNLTQRDLLGLTRTRAIVLLSLFAVTEIALAFTGGGTWNVSWQGCTSLVLILGSAVVSVLPGPFPLRAAPTALIVSVVAVTTVIMSWSIGTNGQAFGYSSWHLGAGTFLLFVLALRGRIYWAWFGMVLMSAITVLWTSTTGQGALVGVDLVVHQWGTLIVGTLFAVALIRSARSIQLATDAENRRIIDAEVERASAEERARHLARLEELVGPALRSIAAGTVHDAQTRAEFLVLEASLRDQIRAAALNRERLVVSARRARRRGVNVILLDDSGESSDPLLPALHGAEIADWVAEQLDTIQGGTFTARLRGESGGLVVTVVAGDLQLSRRFATERDSVSRATLTRTV